MQSPYDREVATAALMLDDKPACRQRVLVALEELMQFDDDYELRAVVRRRYCDLTSDSQAKASEDNGRTSAAMCAPMTGEASRLAAGRTAAQEAACPVSPHGLCEVASTNPKVAA